MKIDILTLFPEICRAPLNESMMKRAQENKIADLHIHNLRDWATDKHRIVDDAPFGAFEQYDVPHEQHTDVDGLIAHVLTWSHTRALEAGTRAKLTRDLDEVLRREHPTPDDVVIPYRTQVHWARRR